jgi:hypothetical protein
MDQQPADETVSAELKQHECNVPLRPELLSSPARMEFFWQDFNVGEPVHDDLPRLLINITHMHRSKATIGTGLVPSDKTMAVGHVD